LFTSDYFALVVSYLYGSPLFFFMVHRSCGEPLSLWFTAPAVNPYRSTAFSLWFTAPAVNPYGSTAGAVEP